MQQKLTIAAARDMPFEDLVSRADELVEAYSAPDTEFPKERIERLGRTIEEMPDLYRWFLTLESFFDHWTDAYADQFGRGDSKYKAMRERRDAMERAASFAKQRWEAASRQITVLQNFDESGMPRARS